MATATPMITDEEYEAKLQARTPEEWTEMMEKAGADEKDVLALRHLWWRRDAKDWEHLANLAAKPDRTLDDSDYILRQVSEIADRLRSARDNPQEREARRWHDLIFCAAMIGSSKADRADVWLQQARDCFPAMRSDDPGDGAPLMTRATYAVECLLDALLMEPEKRAELERVMHSKFLQWTGENGIRAGIFKPNGQLEMLGDVIPFKPGKTPSRADAANPEDPESA